jgi:hypothetical protein
METANQKLRRILTTHPSPSVRDRFAVDVANGAIALGNMRIPNVDAAFVVIPASKTGVPDGTVRVDRMHNRPFVPILIMDESTFASDRKPEAWWQLVLFHEAVHARQYQEGRIDPTAFDMTRRPWDGRDGRRVAEQKWYAEREAYREECLFARQIGAEGLLGPIAASAGTASFEGALLAQLVRSETDGAVRAYFEKRLRRLR